MLDTKYLKISSLKGLKKLVNLVDLSVNSNEISTLTELKNLSELNLLAVDNNQIKTLEPLKNLSKLEFLSANNNKIENARGLENLGFQTLEMQNNYIKDFTQISHHQNYQNYNLDHQK
ncbi:Conserved_hypothetical protein [Hexamita inflata]|uniref:Uncharacterized protein n=1 Tax=Hexamita inflata TaxID=28002 RepID=A0ABP1H832_9EUKA